MIKSHFIYCPERREYLQNFISDEFGLHLVWSYLSDYAYQFKSHSFARDMAMVIKKLDKVEIQVVSHQECNSKWRGKKCINDIA